MAKTFGSLRVGDYVYFGKLPYFWYTPYKEYVPNHPAMVTNIDIIGDDVVVSYRNAYINHTVKAHKTDDKIAHISHLRNESNPKKCWAWRYYVKTTNK